MYKVARETNEELRAIKADPADGFDVGAILSIARRLFLFLDPKQKKKNARLRVLLCQRIVLF